MQAACQFMLPFPVLKWKTVFQRSLHCHSASIHCILNVKARNRYANDFDAGSQPDWIVNFMMRHCAPVSSLNLINPTVNCALLFAGSSGSILIVHSPDVLNSRQFLVCVERNAAAKQNKLNRRIVFVAHHHLLLC